MRRTDVDAHDEVVAGVAVWCVERWECCTSGSKSDQTESVAFSIVDALAY
jgi:hypothetical protein